MRTSFVFGLLALATSARAFCGTNPTADEVAAAQADFVSKLDTTLTLPLSKRSPFTVPVIFNVFYDQNNATDGSLSDSLIAQQMVIVNSFFTQVGLTFNLTKTVRTAIPYNTLHGVAMGNAAEASIKQYRQGNIQTLNIYSVGPNSEQAFAGWATFPWDYQRNPQADGIIMDYDFLFEGKNTGYNTGKILVHEVGHWVGLLHTFEGGCNGGDYVDDTPAEASAASGCPAGRNTCPAPGNDPIDNMMDYSDDRCRVRFTPGQYQRLAQALNQYRGINLF